MKNENGGARSNFSLDAARSICYNPLSHPGCGPVGRAPGLGAKYRCRIPEMKKREKRRKMEEKRENAICEFEQKRV